MITHAAVALAGGRIATSRRMGARFWVAAAALSVLPDVDVIGLFAGVPYGSPFGHRGFTHSLLFAFLVSGGVAALWFRKRLRFAWLVLFLITASHGILDAMTDGGLGVAFFAPFDQTRYFFSWRPIRVSPIGVRAIFSPWGWAVLVTELLYVWLPLGCVLLVVEWTRRTRRSVPGAEGRVATSLAEGDGAPRRQNPGSDPSDGT